MYYILIGSYLVISIYHFILYFLYRKNYYVLYFALLCFNAFLFLITKTMRNELDYKISVIVFILNPIIFLLFGNSFFKKDYNQKILKWFMGFAIVALILTIITPKIILFRYLKYLNISLYLYMGMALVYLLRYTIKAVIRKREDSILLLVGFSMVAINPVIKLISNKSIIRTFTPIGGYMMILIYAFVLARRFSNAYYKSEMTIEKRTKELEKYLRIVKESPNSIVLTDEKMRIEYVNEKYTEEHKKEKFILNKKIKFSKKHDEIYEHLKKNDLWEEEIEDVENKTCEILNIFALKDKKGKTTNFIISKIDMTERKILEKRLEELATIDEMTKIYNRRAGLEILDRDLLRASRDHIDITVVYVDINNLKYTNDNYGHLEGDNLIISTVKILKETIREEDLLIRLGGDEFLVVFVGCDSERIDMILTRLEEKVIKYNKNSEKEYEVSFSYGVANYDKKRYTDSSQLIAEADAKMYIEKEKSIKLRGNLKNIQE